MIEYFQKKHLIQDTRFNFRKADVPADLAKSVQLEGILVPLIATGDREPVVLDGYRRLGFLKEEETVPVQLIRDRKAALRASVELNMLASPYSEMEKACMVSSVLENRWMDDREILDTLLPRLGLKGQQIVLDSCLTVRLLDSKLSEVLAARKAPLKFAARLSRETLDEQLVLTDFFSIHRLSLSRMVQAYDLLVLVRKAENNNFSAIIRNLVEEKEDVLEQLRQKRFPRASEYKKQLGSLLGPYQGKLSFPEDLEGDAFRFSCQLKYPGDARKYAAMLREISENDEIFHFLSEYFGND